MNESQIKSQVIKAIQEITRKENLQIEDNTRLITDLGLESIDFVDLIFECERKLGIIVDLNHFATIQSQENQQRFQDLTLGDIVKALCKLQNEKSENA